MVVRARRATAALAAALAAAPAVAAEAAAPGPGLAGVLQVSLGLGLVLAMVAAAAWVTRRLGVGTSVPAGIVRVRGGVAVGQRERVVVVEVRDTWLVLGVAPGAVRTLHALPRPAEADGTGGPAQAADATFARWLGRALEKQRGRHPAA
ncbi:MAG: flagellar biosynthetic protein FliO [Burkholderiales bacterium]|nr:flagellar biosynthetic protein FliO [Burkholderiales bacterium]